MDARTHIIKWRSEKHLTTDDAAKQLDISVRLLEEIEAGGFTHPKIAMRIQNMIGLTEQEVKQLVSPNHVNDVLQHQVSIRNDRFNAGMPRIYTNQEAEYYDYIDQKFGRRQKA